MGILTDLSNKRCLSNEAMIGKEQMTAFAVLTSVSADGGAIDPIIYRSHLKLAQCHQQPGDALGVAHLA